MNRSRGPDAGAKLSKYLDRIKQEDLAEDIKHDMSNFSLAYNGVHDNLDVSGQNGVHNSPRPPLSTEADTKSQDIDLGIGAKLKHVSSMNSDFHTPKLPISHVNHTTTRRPTHKEEIESLQQSCRKLEMELEKARLAKQINELEKELKLAKVSSPEPNRNTCQTPPNATQSQQPQGRLNPTHHFTDTIYDELRRIKDFIWFGAREMFEDKQIDIGNGVKLQVGGESKRFLNITPEQWGMSVLASSWI
ncbi:hypothetical protein SNE40_019238 [Patella caerulea]|uniref:Uncharacterized protein n=1 Tax=Patella caerulea TaxID=87958 RepID=A0AAN8J6S8_PATCE